ncbi:uncharacterized protein PV06_04810 [Exophiala oligosperma]|uniref:Uncharacterized protein n=2 Tax=Chaetothyriales TaxID=34395 RepID=A0A0D2DL76_9EURO|nr:uncharacterized protein PV06_04810 [Exophiala oligosperma]KAJ9621378.1 hypothetical protein H2204_011939 [Knufia peltigerae]KIW43738.1 hypothetical protein PV06_04810 [Exophiala oligosperma]
MTIKRQTTTRTRTFQRKGDNAVTYDLSRPGSVTITIPVGSRWSSEAHWHETHTEFLQILQGRAFVRLGNDIRVSAGKEGGVIEVPRYTVHEWHRVWQDDEDDEDDLVVREWTVPEDGQKEAFFRMLNSFLTEDEPESLYEVPVPVPRMARNWIERWIINVQLNCIFWACDNWPLLVGNDGRPGMVSWAATHLVLGGSVALGYLLGLRGRYSEYVGKEPGLTGREDGGKIGKKKVG